MTHVLMRAFLALLVSLPLIGFAETARAEDDTPWQHMTPSANPPTVEAARVQCMNSRSRGSGLSAGDCTQFAGMLESGQCERTIVPDGAFHPWLGGTGGKVSTNKRKSLGGDTPVLACRLSNGRTLVWYHRSVIGDTACNNVGELILQSHPPEVTFSKPKVQYHAPEVIVTPGQFIELGCPECCDEEILYLPGTRVVIPRGASTSRRLQ